MPPPITTDHFFDFETFCRAKKRALLDVFLNEYETVNCQMNLISFISYCGPCGRGGGAHSPLIDMHNRVPK